MGVSTTINKDKLATVQGLLEVTEHKTVDPNSSIGATKELAYSSNEVTVFTLDECYGEVPFDCGLFNSGMGKYLFVGVYYATSEGFGNMYTLCSADGDTNLSDKDVYIFTAVCKDSDGNVLFNEGDIIVPDGDHTVQEVHDDSSLNLATNKVFFMFDKMITSDNYYNTDTVKSITFRSDVYEDGLIPEGGLTVQYNFRKMKITESVSRNIMPITLNDNEFIESIDFSIAAYNAGDSGMVHRVITPEFPIKSALQIEAFLDPGDTVISPITVHTVPPNEDQPYSLYKDYKTKEYIHVYVDIENNNVHVYSSYTRDIVIRLIYVNL